MIRSFARTGRRSRPSHVPPLIAKHWQEDGRPMDKAQAQQRADRIRAFREELAALEAEGILELSPDQRRRLERHHDETLHVLARRWDVDTTDQLKQMSVGMRIASFLGAVALSAAVYYFLYSFWGVLATPVQVLVLAMAPLAGLAATEFAARRERTLYIASLLGLVSLAAFIVNLQVLGRTFNVTPSKEAFLVWGALALVLAYHYGFRLLLLAGLVCFLLYLPMTFATWSGHHWLTFGQRPENFFLAGSILLAVPLEARPGRRHDFSAIYRAVGLTTILGAMMVLSNAGETSYLGLPCHTVETLYQSIGFLLAALSVWVGIRRRRPEVTCAGTVFFAAFLVMKFVEWWWDWMPKYAFFLILGALALAVLAILHRARTLHRRSAE
jgi:uncharacterized membrane protein